MAISTSLIKDHALNYTLCYPYINTGELSERRHCDKEEHTKTNWNKAKYVKMSNDGQNTFKKDFENTKCNTPEKAS